MVAMDPEDTDMGYIRFADHNYDPDYDGRHWWKDAKREKRRLSAVIIDDALFHTRRFYPGFPNDLRSLLHYESGLRLAGVRIERGH